MDSGVQDHPTDGEVQWVAGRADTEYDLNGRARRFYGVVTDITDRHRKEMELHASEARFRQLAEAMPQIVWVADPKGQNTYLNRHWTDFTGRTNEVGLSDRWAESIHPDDCPGLRAKWDASVRTRAKYTAEYRLRSKAGAYRWHLVRGVPITDEGGCVVYWYGSSTDIDEQKRLAETLQDADRRKD